MYKRIVLLQLQIQHGWEKNFINPSKKITLTVTIYAHEQSQWL